MPVTPRLIRGVLLVGFAAGIAGMIVTQIASNHGATMAFGLTAAGAVVALILVTAVAAPGSLGPPAGIDEIEAGRVEEQIVRLRNRGADEDALRRLVRDSVRMGRSADSADT